MILKASQRGNAGELAEHLLNGHVEMFSIKGFMAENVHGALQEAHALSLGTKCKRPLFSVSLSPPKDEIVATQIFKGAITRISEKLGFENQPHIDRQMRNPLNFTQAQRQQAKRLNEDPKAIKQALQECWAISDSKKAFARPLARISHTSATKKVVSPMRTIGGWIYP